MSVDTRDPALRAIVDHLRSAHACHTVVLYGSLRALGPDAKPWSDVDLMAMSHEGPARRDTSIVAGLALDAWIYPEPADAIEEGHLILLREGIVLVEEGSQGRNLVERARRIYERGPKPTDAAERAHRLAWATRTVARLRAHPPESGEMRFRKATLVVELLEWWFTLRGMWFLGPRAGLEWLAANRPPAHADLSCALDPSCTPNELARAIDAVFLQD